jgi:hypothetical protein
MNVCVIREQYDRERWQHRRERDTQHYQSTYRFDHLIDDMLFWLQSLELLMPNTNKTKITNAHTHKERKRKRERGSLVREYILKRNKQCDHTHTHTHTHTQHTEQCYAVTRHIHPCRLQHALCLFHDRRHSERYRSILTCHQLDLML